VVRVGLVHREGVHANAHLAGPGHRIVHLYNLESLGSTELHHPSNAHLPWRTVTARRPQPPTIFDCTSGQVTENAR
jgi:hypothetical protein